MQGLDTESTIKQLLFSFKGSQVCKAERNEFMTCRATPSGSSANPEHCEAKVANFLQCYADMVKESKVNCVGQYGNAYDCLKANFAAKDAEEGTCSNSIESFANCK